MQPQQPPNQGRLSAIVLAGGQSSRMGRDKALIEINQIPLIQQTCQVAQHCAEQVLIITPWVERYRDIVPAQCQFIQETPLLGEREAHGPLVGFAQGLAQVQTDWVLLLACDMPHLEADVLQTAAAGLENVPQEAIALLPHSANGWEPLCGFYRRRCLPELSQFIEQGGRSFQRWLAQQSVAVLTLDNPKILFNCNTPEDLATLVDEPS